MNHRIIYYMLITLLLTTTSCEIVVEENLEEATLNENMNFALTGIISGTFRDEGRDLHSIERNNQPCYKEDELILSINLNAEYNLDLILYNGNSELPFTISPNYSAYPHQDIDDKPSYIIARLMKNNNIIYATTFEYGPGMIQPDVFTTTSRSDNLLTVHLRNLRLFDFEKTPAELQETGINSSSIVLNGTFKIFC